jgi:hypothetical protein
MLTGLGVTRDLLSAEDRRSLDRDGYAMFPGYIGDDLLEDLAESFDERVELEGDMAGSEFDKEAGAVRLANCVNKGPAFEQALQAPKVLAAADHVLGGPFKLHGYNARDALPGQGDQNLHADSPERGVIMNSIWLLDDFTADNGATRVVPGSHRRTSLLRDELPDAKSSHPDQIVLEAPRGTVLAIDGRLWHGGTRNDAGTRRRVLHISYIAREHPQQVEQRPNILPALYDRLSEPLRYLLDV